MGKWRSTNPDALTTGQVAEMLGVKVNTLQKWDLRGKFPPELRPTRRDGIRIWTRAQVEELKRLINTPYLGYGADKDFYSLRRVESGI